MPNVFAEKAQKFMGILDEVYQKESLTAFLEMNPLTVMFEGTRTVKLPKIVIDGAADYDRTTGFAEGTIDVSYGSYELNYDRGRKFGVDVIDDDEAAFAVFQAAALEYVRTKEIPEVDAIRFAEMYDKASAGNGTVVTDDLTSATALEAYDQAELVLSDNEVNMNNVIMFASNTYYKDLKNSTAISRRIDAGDVNVNGINRKVQLLDGSIPVIRVPKGRFYDVIQVNDGVTAGQEAGHYEPIVGTSRELNFILADKAALNAVTKRNISKVITAEVNQTRDTNDVHYRNHHDLIILDNKTPGIYIHRKNAVVA